MNRLNDAPWRGYSYDELRSRLLINVAKSELSKRRLMSTMHSVATTDSGVGLLHGVNGWLDGFSSMALMRKMLGALSYVDYAIVAFRLSRRLVGTFRKAKKRKP